MSFMMYAIPTIAYTQTSVSGNITSDTNWKLEQSPINIVGNVGVAVGSKLTIEKGVEVNFTGNYSITVQGKISVEGVSADSVVINGFSTSNIVHMIVFDGADLNQSKIQFAKIKGPHSFIKLKGNTLGLLEVKNSKFSGDAVMWDQSRFDLEAYTSGTDSTGIQFTGCLFLRTWIHGHGSSRHSVQFDESKINNSRIITQVAHKEVLIRNSDVTECELINQHFTNLIVTSSNITNCKFIPEQSGNEMNITFEASILKNTKITKSTFDVHGQKIYLKNSIILNQATNEFFGNNIDASNTLFIGNGTGLEADESLVVTNSSFHGFNKAIKLKGAGSAKNSNFTESTYFIELLSPPNFSAIGNYWQLENGTLIGDKLIDYDDDLTLGRVVRESDRSSLNAKAPVLPIGNIDNLIANRRLFASWQTKDIECISDELEVQLSFDKGFTNNHFILQLSDRFQSFSNPVNLDTLDAGQLTLRAFLPDTVENNQSYLIRVFSTQENTYTHPFEVKVSNFLPQAEFSFPSTLCYGDTATIQYSGNASPNANYTWSFDGGTIISGTGQGPYLVQWSDAGDKNLSLKVSENGCASDSLSYSLNVNSPLVNSFNADEFVCQGDTASIEFTGSAPASSSFSWNLDRGSIVGEIDSCLLNVVWEETGTKNISLTITNGLCRSETIYKSIDYIPVPTVDLSMPSSLCFGDTATIQYSGNASPNANYAWGFDGGTIMSGVDQGPFLIQWSNSGNKNISLKVSENGCASDSLIRGVNILSELATPSICFVTVDSSTDKNAISWTYDRNDVIFNIYRESNISDVYLQIGSISGSDSNTFIDPASSPAQVANRYKISAIDSCGIETNLSPFHKTIHLTINKGLRNSWNLIWDGYEGFSFGTYRIYRRINGGNFELLTEIASNLKSYTDLDVPTPNVAYQIEVLTPDICPSFTNGRVNQVASSRSNIAENNITLGAKNIPLEVNVYPNPVSEYFEIVAMEGRLLRYELVTMTGEVIKSGNLTSSTMVDISEISRGIYILRTFSSSGFAFKKLIKE